MAEPPTVDSPIQLTDKSACRLDEILRARWRSVARKQFGRVRYLRSSRVLPYGSGGVKRIGGEWGVDVEPLGRGGRLLASPWGGSEKPHEMLAALACGSCS